MFATYNPNSQQTFNLKKILKRMLGVYIIQALK